MKIGVPVRRGADVEMVPLIDTFFLLLALFISSVLSMSVMKGPPLELPATRHAERLAPDDLLVVTVAHDGQAQLDGTAVTLEEMRVRLQTTANPSAVHVAVRTDRAVPTGRLVEVLSAIRGAGVHRVGLVTDAAPDAQP